MAVSDTTFSDSQVGCLDGQCVVFVGKLASMSRRDACRLVREQGATIATRDLPNATLVVLGDDEASLQKALANESPEHLEIAQAVAEGRTLLWRESELWQRLGMIDGEPEEGQQEASGGVQRLYTPAMLAELLQAPVAAIRRWHSRGVLVACRCVRRLPYFDFAEVAIARHLVTLLEAGCSLRVIDRKLAELARLMPGVERPLAEPAIVVTGRCLFLRRGEDLAEPCGQLLLDFDAPSTTSGKDSDKENSGKESADDSELPRQHLLKLSQAASPAPSDAFRSTESDATPISMYDQLLQEAADWEDRGELGRAVETYRTLAIASGPTADIHFALADLLYRMGELPAARERYYAAIELDEEYVEARANLGCVLAENDELELAVAAFEGALAFHADYADVYYHLASALDRLEQTDQAESRWKTFLALAPESPWAEIARQRLGLQAADALTVSSPLA